MILALNAGSSSLKYSLFEETKDELKLIISDHLEWVASDDATKAHGATVEKILSKLTQANQIQAIACRVVHGGIKLTQPTLVTATTLDEIRSLSPLAPLHNPIEVEVIESCNRLLPTVPVVAFFDTAFHTSLPPIAAKYALPESLLKLSHIRRYGFHGIAHQYVSETLLACLKLNTSPTRLITCHLGNGASICAIKNGKSVDTTMGFTPMEGLAMGTRSGDIDPGLVLYLQQQMNMSAAEVNYLLNHKSGLLGLSEMTSDARILEKEALAGNKLAEFALDYFSYRAAKYIGAFIVALGGIDAIAFSGGIGENSAQMRARICGRLGFLGLNLEKDLNEKASGKNVECITLSKSRLSAWVIHANEELQMAKDTSALVCHSN